MQNSTAQGVTKSCAAEINVNEILTLEIPRTDICVSFTVKIYLHNFTSL